VNRILSRLLDIVRYVAHGQDQLLIEVKCLRGEVKRLREQLEHPDLRAISWRVGAPEGE